jgi:hypothetical protein
MIGADDGNTTIDESLAEGFAVVFRLDGGIALDASAEVLIVTVGEIKVGNSSFGGDIIGGSG